LISKEFKKMSRYDMVDIILELEKSEQDLQKKLSESEMRVRVLQGQMDKALDLARAALEIRKSLGGNRQDESETERLSQKLDDLFGDFDLKV